MNDTENILFISSCIKSGLAGVLHRPQNNKYLYLDTQFKTTLELYLLHLQIA